MDDKDKVDAHDKPLNIPIVLLPDYIPKTVIY